MKYLGLLLFFASTAYARQIEIPASADSVSLLGAGYNSEKESFVGECVAGETVFEGRPEANINFTSTVSEQELAKDLGFSAGTRFRYGMTTTRASASFLKQSKSSSYSISAIYKGHYIFKNRILKGKALTPMAEGLLKHPERFQEACGDYFSAQQVTGAKIYLSVRVDFKTETAKKAFEANFSLTSPALDIGAHFHKAKDSFNKETRITVSALQVGGRVDKLSQIFADHHPDTQSNPQEGPLQYIQCSMGQLTRCEKVLANMVTYATDVKNGFPSQIDPNKKIGSNEGPALIRSLARPYSDIGVFPGFSPELTLQIKLARSRVAQVYEDLQKQYNQSVYLTREGILRLSPSQREKFSETEADLWLSLQKVVSAGNTCYDFPADCPDAFTLVNPAIAENNMPLYDEGHFLVPPEIFAQYCDLGFSKYAQENFAHTIDMLVDVAKESNPDAFVPVGEKAKVDTCLITQNVLLKMDHLDLSKRNITELKPLVALNHLRSLDLSDNNIEYLEHLKAFDRLRVLDLSHNKVEQVDILAGMTSLTKLRLASNNIKETSPLRSLHQVTRLDLRNNHPDIECPFENSSLCLIADYRYNNSFVRVTRRNGLARWGHQATRLEDGSVLLSGGFRYNEDILQAGPSRRLEIYDHSRGFFNTQVGALGEPRLYHTATLIPGHKVVMIGGFQASERIDLYDVSTGIVHRWTDTKETRARHRALLINPHEILVSGGNTTPLDAWTPSTSTNTAYLLNILKGNIKKVKAMNVPRFDHTMTLLDDGRVLIAGGFEFGAPLRSLEIYDPKIQEFEKIPSRLREGRGLHQAVKLSNGNVAFVGGYGENLKGLRSIEIFNPKTESIVPLEDILDEPRGDLAVTALPNDKLLVIGGGTKRVTLGQNWDSDKHCLASGEIVDLEVQLSTRLTDMMLDRRCGATVTPLLGEQEYFIMGGRGFSAPYSATLFEFSNL